MKTRLFTILSMSILSIAAAKAEVPSWKKGLICGGYRSTNSGGVNYITSKYNILIESAQSHTSRRAAVLFKNFSDGSIAIAHTNHACVQKEDNLICTVDGVSVTIDTGKTAAQTQDSFEAKFYHPLLIVSRTGKCQVKENADSEVAYYSQPHRTRDN